MIKPITKLLFKPEFHCFPYQILTIFTLIFAIKSQKMSCLTILLAIFLLYWIAISALSIRIMLAAFRRYSRYQKIDNPPSQWRALIRDDYHSWNRTSILIGCVLFVPPKLFALIVFHSICIFLISIHEFTGKKFAFLEASLGHYLHISGKIFCKGLLFSVREEFRPEAIRTPMVISNHVSWFDMYYLMLNYGPISFLAKQEVASMPFLGTCAKGTNCIFLKRSNSADRNETMRMISDRIEQFESGKPSAYPLVIFPEGTTSTGKGLLSFKLGAFESLAPITAFCFQYECQGCGLGIDEIMQLESLVLGLSQWPKLRVKRLELAPLEGEKAEEYCERAKEMIREALGVFSTEGGYRDSLELMKYRKEHLKKEK